MLEKRGLLHAVMRLGRGRGTEVHLICLHLGLIKRSRIRQATFLADLVQREVPADAPLIIAGDFNDWQQRVDGLLRTRLGVEEVAVAARSASRAKTMLNWLGYKIGPVWMSVGVGLLAALVIGDVPHLEWIVVAGLGVFGFACAVNSSVHSYLVLAYAGSEKAAEDVGFYYAANALGRFFGTLMSGLLYQWGGLAWSLAGSAAMLAACWAVTLALPLRHELPATPEPVAR